jgi:type II secretory pathway component PulF
MSRRTTLVLGLLFSLAVAALVLRLVLPVFANLFAGLGVEIPLPAAWVVRHPALVFIYLTVVVSSPIVFLLAVVFLLVRLYRTSRRKASSTES